ncbi:5,10-methylenetetrahydrofolate reductase, small subunit [hydrothermal vent metagenome]|uniref:5,10-methylenetetrahydrofolate reductase, small subunit n=1 Tax=hydrothermal vent metagenome TaxID=652676 RepID=A0A3B0S6A8_9ZZZZ
MYAVRLFCTRHARVFESVYQGLEKVFLSLHPLLKKIGYNRLERPVALVEKISKGLLFDCKMCGQCVLSSTGMSCPMNCPKNIRNGPCGGVRDGGFCEVSPKMRCVWVEAWTGAEKMKDGLARIRVVQPPVNRELKGSSSWLRVVREKGVMKDASKRQLDPDKSELAQAFAKARKLEPAAVPLAREPVAALAEQAVKEQTSVLTDDGVAD